MRINPVGIYDLSSTKLLNEAYDFICLKRLNHSHNNFKWEHLLPPLQSYDIDGQNSSSWHGIVLKAMSLLLSPLFKSLQGGVHQVVKEVEVNIHGNSESIQHDILLTEFKKEIQCEGLIKLLEQYLQRLEIRDGIYYHFLQGILKGCPLSPLMVSLMLKPLDDALFYCRFMDDWVILVTTKSQLRRVIKMSHRILKQLKLKMHPDKTMIGRIAKQSIENHRLRISRRDKQGMSKYHIDLDIKRWEKWCRSLLTCCHQCILSMEKDAITRIQLVDDKKEKHHEKIYETKWYPSLKTLAGS
jgi:hypothetical protein